MKLLDIIAIVTSLLSVAASIVALILCVRREKMESALQKNIKSEHKDRREELPNNPTDNLLELENEFIEKHFSYLYSEPHFWNYSATKHMHINEGIGGDSFNGGQDISHQALYDYLRKLFPSLSEYMLICLCAEIEEERKNDHSKNEAEIEEKRRARIAALGKGVSDQ